MHMKTLLFFSLLATFFHTHFLKAQLLQAGLGAETYGMGNTQAAGQQAESIFGNVASIGFADNLQAISGIRSQFGGYFTSMGLGVNLPNKLGNAAFSVMRFGDKIYSEQQLSVAFAVKSEGVKIGFRTNLLQVQALGAGSLLISSFDVGVITQLSNQLWLGAYASNVSQAGFQTKDYIEKLPSSISIGIRFLPVQNFTLQADVVKEVENKVSFRAGCQYALTPQLATRTGIDSATGSMHWGVSFSLKKIAFHYALARISRLGNTHQLGLVVNFKSVRKVTKQLQEDEKF